MTLRRPICLVLACASISLTNACSTITSPDRPNGLKSLSELPPFSLLTDILTTTEDERAIRDARAQGLSLMDPSRKPDLDQVFKAVYNATKATKYSDNRIKIHSDGAIIGSNDRSELDFFIRAAAETLQEGYDGFVVVHLDYYKAGPQLFSLTPNLNFSSDRWIGTYEGFLKHRNEHNMFETRSGVNRKVRQGVILMVKDDDFPNRDRFDASEIYLNLLETRFNL